MLSALAAVLLLVSGCSFHAKVGSIHPKRELVQYRPKGDTAKIDAVSLGTSDSNNFDESKVRTSFPTGTARVLVWYQWHEAEKGRHYEIHWFFGNRQVLAQDENAGDSSGESSWALFSPRGALPPGSYHVDLLENGQVVTSIPFAIGG
jgi:hypothetical protein